LEVQQTKVVIKPTNGVFDQRECGFQEPTRTGLEVGKWFVFISMDKF
jgi:hypothetical protein